VKPTIYPNMKGTLYVFPGVGGTLGDLHAKRLGSIGTLKRSGGRRPTVGRRGQRGRSPSSVHRRSKCRFRM